MTTFTIVAPYLGGKGFVTTEQVAVTASTMRAPVTFSVAGEPKPKGLNTRADKRCAPWQRAVQTAARTARLTGGEMGAFQPATVVLQFATDEPARADLLARSTLDGMVHAHLLHDDSAVVDLVVTTRPVSSSPTRSAGVWVTVFPFPVLTDALLSTVRADLRGTDTVIQATPRVLGDGREALSHSTTRRWMQAVKETALAVDGPCTLVAAFALPRWLEPDNIHHPIVNGRDVDKLARAVGHAANYDVRDLIASKRLSETPGAALTVTPGTQITLPVLNRIFEAAGG